MSVSQEQDYYQETIALLQEEIVRLEIEIRSRDDQEEAPAAPAPRDVVAEAAASRQVASLLDELANRDETINLLLEQSRLFEEAESADRASWDQLNQWVQELERRVDSGGGSGAALRDELETERRRAERDREEHETERRSFQAQHKAWEAETEKLRGLLTQATRQPDGSGDSVLKALEKENRRLRAATGELARVSAAASQAESLRDRLETAEAALARSRADLQQTLDDLQRERQEHQAIVAGLRSQNAHETLKRQEEQVLAAVTTGGVSTNPDLSPDERIRAFRQHLKEIHEKEEHERAEKKLSARLSRLWRNTGPRG